MNLSEFFTENPQAAIAFSGGVDSGVRTLGLSALCSVAVRDKSAGLLCEIGLSTAV